jgi:hypothetical protein
MTLGRTESCVSNRVRVMTVEVFLTGVASTARKDDLADVDTSDKAVGLAESTTHTSLKSIGTGARQHLVDTDDVVGVGADAEVEGLLTGGLHHVPWMYVSYPFRDSIGFRIAENHTCWRKYGQPQGPQRRPAHTRWRRGERKEGTRRRWPSCDQDRRCESWGRGHHG